jgi:glycosyltransferase involved in cell wall biosynthesis
MKVAIFATVVGVGGIQTHTRGMAEVLLEAGCEVLILSSVLDAGTVGEAQSGENEALLRRGARIILAPAQGSAVGRMRELTRLAGEVRRFQPDVYYVHGRTWHGCLLPLFFSRKVRRVFYEGMSGEVIGRVDPRYLVRLLFDDVIGQSPKVSRNFERCFHWRGPTCAIPALPEPLEDQARLPDAAVRRVAPGRVRAAMFSRLVPGKQAYWLVQQWDKLKDVLGELHIHGRGPDSEPIAKYIAQRGLQDRVKLCGRYPTGQAYVDLLAGYDLTLLPTIFPEGAPLVLLESMACGVPFVANGVGGIPDYATDNPDCIVVPEQTQFLEGVHRLARMLADGEVNQSRLQRLYFRRYSRKALGKAYLEFFKVGSA